MNSLETAYREGRIIRDNWSGTDAKGRQLLCLLTALANDPNVRPETCPAHLCPAWLAHLLPWIDDAGTERRWPDFIERCVQLAPWWGRMTPQQSRHLDLYARQVALLEARQIAGESTKVVDDVLALIALAMNGDEPLPDDWTAARRAASQAARETARSRTAARKAASAAADAADETATQAATWAVWEADVQTADRMIDAILTEMERVQAGGVIHTRSKA